jgi:hypothetical protein
MNYYGMDGQVLDRAGFAALYEGDFETTRKVASDKRGDVTVSTVLLGIDHRFGDDGPPLIFETMIFGGPHNEYQERYSTREQAEEGHRRACDLAFEGTP